MRLLGSKIINNYRYRIINIHPALLPSFPGLNAQKQALQYGVKISGCTVHFVDEGIDTGPIILQHAVEVKQTDNEETLSDRILKYEHQLLPRAIQLFAKKRITIEKNIAHIT
jgi:phosphoribosylglycinamide formyltransferase-1